MSVAYATLTDAEKAKIQNYIKSSRDAAQHLVLADKAVKRSHAESIGAAAAIAKIDAAEVIPPDGAVQGTVDPFAADATATLLASMDANATAVQSVIEQVTPWAVWGQMIGPQNQV
jgi:hypothetical protein